MPVLCIILAIINLIFAVINAMIIGVGLTKAEQEETYREVQNSKKAAKMLIIPMTINILNSLAFFMLSGRL